MDITLSNVFLTLLAGLTSVASPCVLPVIPIVITGTAKDHKFRPLLIVLGLSCSFILMGILSSAFSDLIGSRIFYFEKAVGLLIAAFGVLMLFDINLFKRLTFFSQLNVQSQGRWSGVILGLSLGIIWIPCIGPILSGVLALVATQGKMANGAVLLAIYSIGFSIPILIAGYGSHFFRVQTAFIQKHPVGIRVISGGMLIIFGIYIFKQGMLGFSF